MVQFVLTSALILAQARVLAVADVAEVCATTSRQTLAAAGVWWQDASGAVHATEAPQAAAAEAHAMAYMCAGRAGGSNGELADAHAHGASIRAARRAPTRPASVRTTSPPRRSPPRLPPSEDHAAALSGHVGVMASLQAIPRSVSTSALAAQRDRRPHWQSPDLRPNDINKWNDEQQSAPHTYDLGSGGRVDRLRRITTFRSSSPLSGGATRSAPPLQRTPTSARRAPRYRAPPVLGGGGRNARTVTYADMEPGKERGRAWSAGDLQARVQAQLQEQQHQQDQLKQQLQQQQQQLLQQQQQYEQEKQILHHQQQYKQEQELLQQEQQLLQQEQELAQQEHQQYQQLQPKHGVPPPPVPPPPMSPQVESPMLPPSPTGSVQELLQQEQQLLQQEQELQQQEQKLSPCRYFAWESPARTGPVDALSVCAMDTE